MDEYTENLRAYSEAMNATLTDLAARLGVTECDPGQLADAVESLKRDRDSLANALRIARAELTRDGEPLVEFAECALGYTIRPSDSGLHSAVRAIDEALAKLKEPKCKTS